MRRIKQKALALFILGGLSLLFVFSVWAEEVPQEVLQAAKEGKTRFWSSIPEEQLMRLGFESEDELDNSTLGTPFRVYTINPAEVMSFGKGDDISSIISPTNLWLFPIVCSGESRVLLTVDLFEGKSQAVNLGESPIAAEMDRVRAYLAQFDDYDVRFVRIYQASSDFMLLTKDQVSKIVPLAPTAYNIGLIERGETYAYGQLSPSEVISKLAPAVEKNLKMSQE